MRKSLTKDLIKSIRSVTKSKYPKLHEPYLDNLEINELKKCIYSSFVSTAGPQVKKFEKKISQLTGAKYVVATNSGTSALHLALKALSLKKNTEVLIPTLNFVASGNVVEYCNAIPHFVDSDINNLSIDSVKLEAYLNRIVKIKNGTSINLKTKRPISALILVHIFGHSGNVKEIRRVCSRFKIDLIEDAAESIGSFFQKKHLGTFGKCGVLSFNGNKTVTTGAGGALITNDKKLAKTALKLSLVSKVPHNWKLEYDAVGYNYRMPSINASLGLSQLKKLNLFLILKKKLFLKYKKEFKKYSEFNLLDQPKNCKSNFWLNTIILKTNSFYIRDNIIRKLNENGVQVRPCWSLLHKLNQFSSYPKMNLITAEKLEKKIINIPSSAIYGK